MSKDELLGLMRQKADELGLRDDLDQALGDERPSRVVSRLIQAQAHAEADPRPTSLKIWRDGVEVEMWEGGRRIAHRVSWIQIEAAHINPVMDAIDSCAVQFSKTIVPVSE